MDQTSGDNASQLPSAGDAVEIPIYRGVHKRRNPSKSPEKGPNSCNPQKKADIERESKRGPNS